MNAPRNEPRNSERHRISSVEFLLFDTAVLIVRGAIWFVALAGPVACLWHIRSAHPLLVLAAVLMLWPIAGLTFVLELVVLKQALGKIPACSRFVLGVPASFRWTAAILLVETQLASPFRHLISRNIVLRWLYYRGMGARIDGTFLPAEARIMDPWALKVGQNVLVGNGATIVGHKIVRGVVTLGLVEIGNNVTIGGNALVFPGVRIGDGAVIGAGSVVASGTVIPPGEIWAGSPARKMEHPKLAAETTPAVATEPAFAILANA